MVNIEGFVKRLEKIFEYYNLNASTFADKIGVQRSSLSHLLSGRNKPSLDFILKVLEQFPEIDIYWILNGKGQFPKTIETKIEANTNALSNKPDLLLTDFLPKNKIAEENLTKDAFENFSNEIEQIVVFYKNGTFKVYLP